MSTSFLFKKFDSTTVQRGKKYFSDGYVKDVKQTKEGYYASKVRGSGRSHYTQSIQFSDNEYIKGSCTCPVGIHCKHIAAVIMELNSQKSQKIGSNNDNIKTVHKTNKSQTPVKKMSSALEEWLNSFQEIDNTSNAPKKEVVYVLSYRNNHFTLVLHTVKILKSGKFLEDNPLNIQYYRTNIPQYFTDDDTNIVRMIQNMYTNTYDNIYSLKGKIGYMLLQQILQTNKVFWQEYHEDKPLKLSDISIQMSLKWDIDKKGMQKLKLYSDEVDCVSQTTPMIGVNIADNQLYPIVTEYTEKILQYIEKMPSIAQKDVEAFQHNLEALSREKKITLPKLEKITQTKKQVKPKLHLVFTIATQDFNFFKKEIPVIELKFDYDGIICPVLLEDKKPELLFKKDNNEFIQIERDVKFETKAIRAVFAEDHYDQFDATLSSTTKEVIVTLDKWVDFVPLYVDIRDFASVWKLFLHTLKSKLANNDTYIITVKDDFPYGDVNINQDWQISFDESPSTTGLNHQIDWFDMNVMVDIEGQKIPALPVLLKILDTTPFDEIAKLDPQVPLIFEHQGHCLVTKIEKVLPILEILKDLHHLTKNKFTSDGAIRFDKSDIMVLEEIRKANESAQMRLYTSEKLDALREKMQSFTGIEQIEVPKMLQATLRPYQYEGLTWLNFLREYGFSGILADDMGLGKTLQSLAWLALEKEQNRLNKPVLIVAPTSLMFNWINEIRNFVPDLTVTLLHGADRKTRYDDITKSDIVLTTYPLLSRDKETLLANHYYALILDEAQNIKNPKTQSTQILHQVKAEHRLCLTGTPMENHLGELWSLFHFLQPGLLANAKDFNQFYRKEIEKNDNNMRQESLMRRLKPFMLRRTKKAVATELPPKTEFIRKAELGKKQASLYEAVRLSMNEKVRDIIAKQGIAKSQIIILDALLKMRQVCCHPQLLNLPEAKSLHESAKLDMLMEMLPEMVEEGHKILIFSSFTTMLAKISEQLDSSDIGHVTLTGQTKKRAEVIEKFKTDKDIPVFLISLKAGGVGLNLTEADIVIHFDPWWNPAAEQQASDRAYRIGQDKPVFVYKLIIANSIEEKILELQAKKQKLADALFDPSSENESLKITQSDIQDIFNTPLGG